MKTFIFSAVAASLIASPVLAAPNGHDNRGRIEQTHRAGPGDRRVVVRKTVTRAQQHRQWRKGERFDSRYASNYRVIGNPRAYRLNAAPRGYRWVQSGQDAVLIGIASGVIASIVANSIR